MKLLIPLLLLLTLVTACESGPGKAELDAEVRRLCAIDGGVRVYETVMLPAEKFNQSGQINFFRPDQGENALGMEYIYKWTVDYYKKGNPAVDGAQETSARRDHIKIIRRSDLKLIGEVVKYHRAGGDLPGPWMPSSYHCPDVLDGNEIILMNKIFLKSIEEEEK